MPRRSSTTSKKATLPREAEGEERDSRIVHLTQRIVNGLAAPSERMRLTDSRYYGLSIRLEPSGNHSWQVRLPSKKGSRQIWETIGKVADMSLRVARKKTEALRGMTSEDSNTRQALEKDKAQKLPFEKLAEAWMEDYVSRKKPGTQSSYREKLDIYILPRFQGKKLKEIDTAAIRAWHETITAKGVSGIRKDSLRPPRPAATAADRALGTLTSFFKYAIEMKWVLTNPTRDVPHNGDHKIHRPMDEDARRKVGQAIREMLVDGSANPIYLMAVQLSLTTSLRREALASLEWSEVHLERRVLRLVTKATTAFDPQHLPIGPAAFSILKSIPHIADSPYVFPGRDPKTHMAYGTLNATWSKVRARAGVFGDYIETDRYGNLIDKPAIRVHDLRHTKTAKLAESHDNAMVGSVVGIKTSKVIDRYSHPVKAKVAEANEALESDFAEDLGIDVDPEFYAGHTHQAVEAPNRVQLVIQVGSWPPIKPRTKQQGNAEPPPPKSRATKASYPPDEDLQRMVLDRPVSVIASELGVTAKSLEKWCKRRGITVRPRGYWGRLRAEGGKP